MAKRGRPRKNLVEKVAKFYKEIDLETTFLDDGKIYVKRLIQDEVDYTPEQAMTLSKSRIFNKTQKKTYHKEDPNFNPEKFQRKYNEQIRFTDIVQKFQDKIQRIPYLLPEKLVNQVKHAIKTEYYTSYTSTDARKKRIYKSRLDQALYLCIAIYHFNQKKNNDLKNLKTLYSRKKQETPEKELNKIKYTYDVKYRL